MNIEHFLAILEKSPPEIHASILFCHFGIRSNKQNTPEKKISTLLLLIASVLMYLLVIIFYQICFCSATGASFCYLLSYLVGRRLVKKYLPERSADWANKVQKHKDNLMSYIIFLRITPFLPNWFINIVSPVIDVHLKPFWIGT